MFYDHAEATRLLINELSVRAFRRRHYDAMRAAGMLIEAYLLAMEQEDEDALNRIDELVSLWIEHLRTSPAQD
ncbi:hypothetical protein [Deinococcus ruber]|uniref:Uncharacterized protein n=1 Tax=Deinococcus ruber TaxID=1848197 RepID=A0A918FJ63_9DEIO|nr:hypothetical protein [Deinococcus ruber]GGR41304.1 hypothetical protein GCM10008957_56670 [Deinococcus ruber]